MVERTVVALEGGEKQMEDVITSNNDCFHFQCLWVMNQVKMKHK